MKPLEAGVNPMLIGVEVSTGVDTGDEVGVGVGVEVMVPPPPPPPALPATPQAVALGVIITVFCSG